VPDHLLYDQPVTQPASTELWTTRRLLAWMQEAFSKKNLDAPRKQAEMLLEHVLGCRSLDLYMNVDRPASPLERDTLRNLVTRALKHEPIQYLIGKERFFGLEFHVDKRVLIPRPETQTIVEEVLQHARAQHGVASTKGEGMLIGDVCTGSGCIAIALLKNLTAARGVAVDVSAEALEVARQNAVRHGVIDRLELLAGDLLTPLAEHPPTRGEGSLDYLVSNPPYIPDDEWAAVEPNVKDYEPHIALRGGRDGMDFVRRLVAEGARYVRPGGLLLIELAESRAGEGLELIKGHPLLADARVLKDFLGKPRVIVARRA
jgi:release factor glutamine methyltransferase